MVLYQLEYIQIFALRIFLFLFSYSGTGAIVYARVCPYSVFILAWFILLKDMKTRSTMYHAFLFLEDG